MVTFTKKELGLITTPSKTADYLVARLGKIPKEAKVLDPCIGPGALVKALLRRKVEPRQITAFDISEDYLKSAQELGVDFRRQDALLSLTPFSYNEFDFIVGNPPYLSKASEYLRQKKISLRKIYGKIIAHETYGMFLVNGIRRLKNGGRLAFITSDSFLTLNTHTKLRKYLLNNCKLEELLLAPKKLFDNQGVKTSPLIIILTKCVGRRYKERRSEHLMKVVERVDSEEEYYNPKQVMTFKQKKYQTLPYKIFFTDVEEGILEMFRHSDSLEKHLKGYIGMHTMNNKKYISTLGKVKDLPNWKPYLKVGGKDQYYRPVTEAVYLGKEAIKEYLFPTSVPFGKEGVVISGISARLAARYMPEGCYWDSNKAMGFMVIDKELSLNYLLGLLNSSLYNYLAKGILNRTNCVQLTDLHALPFVPPDNKTKTRVEKLVEKIIKNKQKDMNFDSSFFQKELDEIIFTFHQKRFRLTEKLREKLYK